MLQRHYYQIGGVTIQLEANFLLTDNTFRPKFTPFRVEEPGHDVIKIQHKITHSHVRINNLGEEVYRNPPWRVYENENGWIYLSYNKYIKNSKLRELPTYQMVVINHDYSNSVLYHYGEKLHNYIQKGNLNSLSILPTDSLILAHVFAERDGLFFHSSGVKMDNQGFLFLGPSGAGKSTIASFFIDHADVLCDERLLLRKEEENFRMYGTWSHGSLPIVSPSSAPLKAMMFLEKASENRIILLHNKKDILYKLLQRLIRPFETPHWWNKIFSLLDALIHQVPAYIVQFDKSGKVVDLIRNL
ncbi:MAG: hypothetical protein ACFFBD_16955 [Candidatus Hodarchaeota archaeon]